jgi:hypothetical protein
MLKGASALKDASASKMYFIIKTNKYTELKKKPITL